MSAASVGRPSPQGPTAIGTSSSTLKRDPLNVQNVGKPSNIVLPSFSTRKSTLEKGHKKTGHIGKPVGGAGHLVQHESPPSRKEIEESSHLKAKPSIPQHVLWHGRCVGSFQKLSCTPTCQGCWQCEVTAGFCDRSHPTSTTGQEPKVCISHVNML